MPISMHLRETKNKTNSFVYFFSLSLLVKRMQVRVPTLQLQKLAQLNLSTRSIELSRAEQSKAMK